MKKLIIIPAFNEKDNIKNVIESLKKYLNDFDYIVVNDCSTDDTLKICKQNNINVINLPINLGIGGAVQTGYIYAYRNHYDIAIQLDGDGQHDPTYLYELIKPIENGTADMVIGSRFLKREGFQTTFCRRLGIHFFHKLILLFYRIHITDSTSGFRACSKELIKYFAQKYPKDYPEPESVSAICRKRFKVVEIPVKMNAREHGASSINITKSIYYMFKVTLAIIINAIKPKKSYNK